MCTLNMGLKFVATSALGIFTGGAVYINAVEHPSRRPLVVAELRKEWANSFNIASKFLPSFGLLASACSTSLYFLETESDLRMAWLVPPVTFLLGGAYTVVFMLPEINILLDERCIEKKGEDWVRAAVDRWNARHMFRTFLDAATYFTVLYLTMQK